MLLLRFARNDMLLPRRFPLNYSPEFFLAPCGRRPLGEYYHLLKRCHAVNDAIVVVVDEASSTGQCHDVLFGEGRWEMRVDER